MLPYRRSFEIWHELGVRLCASEYRLRLSTVNERTEVCHNFGGFVQIRSLESSLVVLVHAPVPRCCFDP